MRDQPLGLGHYQVRVAVGPQDVGPPRISGLGYRLLDVTGHEDGPEEGILLHAPRVEGQKWTSRGELLARLYSLG